MNKLVIAIMSGLISATVFADRPLSVQHGEPAALGEPVEYKALAKTQYSANTYSNPVNYKTSLNIAYAGTKLGSNDLGGDEKFNGVDIGLSSISDKLVIGVGYTYLKGEIFDVDTDVSQLYSKLGYNFFNQDNTYGIASIGLGYTWASGDSFDLDLEDFPDPVNLDASLEYFTIPLELEIGHYLQNNMAVYGAIGYQWLMNTSFELCGNGVCESDSFSELDVDGVTYKVGLRFNF